MASGASKKDQVRISAETNLETFIRLVHPRRVLGGIHRELIQWWTRGAKKSHQLALLPRDHQKSVLLGYRCAQRIVRQPDVKILYISSTSNLAIKQLGFIKDILTSDVVRMYWPDLIHPDEGKRTKWTESEISVDHPSRRLESVRDPTVFTAGLTTSITGLHCDVCALDDVVVKENAYTEDGREKTRQQYSLLSSIEAAEAEEWAVGTRYDPNDLYNDMAQMEIAQWDPDGNELEGEKLYEIFERQVESLGDGTGEFLWPRQQRFDGKWFGFDARILAVKKAQYLDQTQFRAQYYNDPNDRDAGLNRDDFQYYDKSNLNFTNGRWFLKNTRLNVFAAIDFAWSLTEKADYTAIVVVGIDGQHNIYVLDIDRFKTKEISEYFKRILASHQKWEFNKICAECSAAQELAVNELKNNYIRPQGIALVIEPVKPDRNQGTKEERINAILQHRYNNKSIWHYMSGNCQILEDELMLSHPAHDDVKDALSNAVMIASKSAPTMSAQRNRDKPMLKLINGRFGGMGG